MFSLSRFHGEGHNNGNINRFASKLVWFHSLARLPSWATAIYNGHLLRFLLYLIRASLNVKTPPAELTTRLATMTSRLSTIRSFATDFYNNVPTIVERTGELEFSHLPEERKTYFEQ